MRRTFGAEAAPWDIASDNDPSRGSLVPSLDYDESFDEVTARTGMGEVTHEEDPAFNSTVMENSEQATHTTTVVSTVTTVTNSSLVSSTISIYSTGFPPRAYESIYKGFSSRLNQPRSVMSTSVSLNQNETRDKIVDSQNITSQHSYNLPRVQSTMYRPFENSHLSYTQANISSGAEHYTQYLFQDQQTRQPIGAHIYNRQLPPFIKAPYVPPPRTSQPQTARVHFENQLPVDSEPLINLNKTSRIGTSQSSNHSRTESGPLGEANLQLLGPQSAGAANPHPAANQSLSSRIGYPQSSINQQILSGFEEARYNPQPPLVGNARLPFAGQSPQQGVDGSGGFYPPNFGYQWPYTPMFANANPLFHLIFVAPLKMTRDTPRFRNHW